MERKELQATCSLYAQLLNKTLNGPQGGINLESLCIIPGKVAWCLNVDVLILDWGGNIFDAVVMAVRGML